MNTRMRRGKREESLTFEELMLKNLVDESKFYTLQSNNKWDRTMKMASVLTKKYVQGLSKMEGFCKTPQNKFVCDIFSVN